MFIFGLFGLPAMGIMGAALATMIARFVELAIVLFYSKKMNRTIRFRISDLFAQGMDFYFVTSCVIPSR